MEMRKVIKPVLLYISVFVLIGILLKNQSIIDFLNLVTANRLVYFYSNETVNSICVSIWQVQATISTMGLVVLTLMISKIDDKIYGFSKFRIIIEGENCYFFKLIILCISVIPVSYLFVVQTNFLGSLLGLVLTSWVLLVLLIKGIIYLLYPEKVENLIRNIVYDNLKELIEKHNKEYV